MKKDNLKILVCCHKLDSFKSDDVYMPIHVGKANSSVDIGIQGDDEGDNISSKNASYCELTGLYWAWKNLKDVDYIGLCHYRRYFNFHTKGTMFSHYTLVKSIEDINWEGVSISKLFNNYDIVLSKPKIYPYSIFVDYCVCHYSVDIKIVEKIIIEKDPLYRDSINHVFKNHNKLSPCNMFIMKRDEFDSYCEWLFAILEEAEQRINISNYNNNQKRIYGFLAERLLNLYVYHNKMRVKNYPIYWINDSCAMPNVIQRYQKYIRKILSFALIKGYRTKKL